MSEYVLIYSSSIDYAQINDLSHVPVPVMLLPDDFKASTKIKVSNHLFNKYCAPPKSVRLIVGTFILLPLICTDLFVAPDLYAGLCLMEIAVLPLENNNAFTAVTIT